MGTHRLIGPMKEVSLGDPRVFDCMRLTGAYRSLPRPSSASEPSHPPISVNMSSLMTIIESPRYLYLIQVGFREDEPHGNYL